MIDTMHIVVAILLQTLLHLLVPAGLVRETLVNYPLSERVPTGFTDVIIHIYFYRCVHSLSHAR
jgi:hypothetical protein